MKIAIATNDRKTIAKRTGRAAEFSIYHIENGEIISIDHQKNTHEHEDHDRNEGNHRQGPGGGHRHANGRGQGGGQGHGHGEHHHHHDHDHEHGEHTHDEIITQLKGIDLLYVRAIGKYMKKDLQNGNIAYKLVKVDEIEKIIATHLKPDS